MPLMIEQPTIHLIRMRAYYQDLEKRDQVPDLEAMFRQVVDFYTVLLSELAAWQGSAKLVSPR